MKFQSALQGWRVLILFILVAFVISASNALASEVSVRLRPLKGQISVTGSGLTIRSGAATVVQTQGFGKFLFRFSNMNGVPKWSVEGDQSKREVPARKLEIFGEGLRVDLRPAPSHVQLVGRKEGSKLDLVGHMSLEDYLEGVVAGEVPRDWPFEALKAQAVAARSFTVAKVLERESLGADWLFEATVQDQVFDHERVHSRATDAVRATLGEVLIEARGGIGHAGKVVAANYHSDCGGTTDEPSTVWGGRPTFNGTAKDSACAMKPRNSWRYVSDVAELAKKLKAGGVITPKFQLSSLSIGQRSPGGRALTVIARAKDGGNQVFSGERLRAALGYSDLKSTLFNVSVTDTPAIIEFIGKGFGHGTGLCQWGARSLALSGRSYQEILRHYYPRLQLSGLRNDAQAIAAFESSLNL